MDEGVDAHLPTPGTTLDLFEPTPDGVVDGRGLRQPGEFGPLEVRTTPMVRPTRVTLDDACIPR